MSLEDKGSRFLVALGLLAALACGKGQAGPAYSDAGAPPSVPPAAEAPPQPYSYPAPVSGHYKEVNTGDFDLVDGLAWGPTRAGETAVYVTDKPIASPILGDTCPMAEARALSVLRDARWNEVNLDASGKSRYFGAGTQYSGTSRSEDVGSHDWKFTPKAGAGGGRIAGKVTNKYYGSFEFDLPTRQPRVAEVSEIERMDGGLTKEGMPVPDAARLVATFAKIRSAALAKDLKGWLAAQGFSAEQIAAIRGLDGNRRRPRAARAAFPSAGDAQGGRRDRDAPGRGLHPRRGRELRRQEVHQLLLPRALRRSPAAGDDRRESAVIEQVDSCRLAEMPSKSTAVELQRKQVGRVVKVAAFSDGAPRREGARDPEWATTLQIGAHSGSRVPEQRDHRPCANGRYAGDTYPP